MSTSEDLSADIARALAAPDSSVRLRAAMAAGSEPDLALLEPLIDRCAVEPDFFVREMLTWALVRLPAASTLPALRRELDSPGSQARSQALHTLSKIGDRSAWPWITRELMRDADDDVARTAWRTAVALVPDDERAALAEELARQFGRGDHGVRRSLSRALVQLADVSEAIVSKSIRSPDRAVAQHAAATERMLHDPDADFVEDNF